MVNLKANLIKCLGIICPPFNRGDAWPNNLVRFLQSAEIKHSSTGLSLLKLIQPAYFPASI
jgi:hypothetical protein